MDNSDAVLKLVQDLVLKKLGSLLGKKITIDTVKAVIKTAMESVDEISASLKTALSGQRKEQIVSDVIKIILNQAAERNLLSADLRDKLVSALDTLGPVVFQLIVAADKGDFDFQHIRDEVKKCGCF